MKNLTIKDCDEQLFKRKAACKTSLIIAMTLCLSSNLAFASVKPSNLFTNHMVLQYNMPSPVWGTADPGEKISIKIAQQKISTTAGSDGRWMVKLGKLKPGGPYTLVIAGKADQVTIQDVYAGEVWLCAGQSNMDMTVAREDRYWCGVFNETEEVASANYPLIRVFDTEYTPKAEPQASVNGTWEIVSPTTVGHLSAAAYFFARDLQKKLNMPIGLITTAFGASTAEAWTRAEALKEQPDLKYLVDNFEEKIIKFNTDTAGQHAYALAREKWKIAAAEAKAQGKPDVKGPANKNPDPVRDQHNPSVLWNGMVAPLVPYGIRGAIWYQGESNSPTAKLFRKLNETLINDWRKQWGQGSFPFIYVQLANIGTIVDTIPAKGGSEALKREAQLQNLSVPNTGMVVAIDNADPENMLNVHCKNKQEIGRRLALIAEATVYGEKITYSGPMFDKMKIDGNSIRLHFTHTDGGLVAKDGNLKGFAIAGDDKKFVWGTAKIEGDEVVVSSPGIGQPQAVRYGFGDNPPTSLYNAANLPASPFRTDAL
jgi:sialate O-acetylesterase